MLPGGFAHGDYLRPGAIARFSPVMEAVRELAAAGGPVVGICNGFQVLTEAGLAARRAAEEPRPQVPVHHHAAAGRDHRLGAHRARRPWATCCASRSTTSRATTPATPRRSPSSGPRTASCVRYVDNPNGSVDDIAGVCNEGRNVVGLMPHPERACHALLGSTDGAVLLRSLLVSAGAAVGLDR